MKTDNTLEKCILDYLQNHPDACDTLEGAAKWWVMSQQVTNTTLAVRDVLVLLKKKGIVEERESPDGQTLYFLKKSE